MQKADSQCTVYNLLHLKYLQCLQTWFLGISFDKARNRRAEKFFSVECQTIKNENVLKNHEGGLKRLMLDPFLDVLVSKHHYLIHSYPMVILVNCILAHSNLQLCFLVLTTPGKKGLRITHEKIFALSFNEFMFSCYFQVIVTSSHTPSL